MLPNLQSLFEGLQERLGDLLLTIGCDCFLRRLELEDDGSLDQIGSFLREQRVMGFNTYGEPVSYTHLTLPTNREV